MAVRDTGRSTQSCHMAVGGTEVQGGPLSHVIWLWEVDLQRYRAVHSVMSYGCERYRAVHSVMSYGCERYRDTGRSTQSCHMAVGGTEVQGGPLSHVMAVRDTGRSTQSCHMAVRGTGRSTQSCHMV